LASEPIVSFRFDVDGVSDLEDGELVLCRGWRAEGESGAVLAMLPTAMRPMPASLDRLAHEYELRDEHDAVWATRLADPSGVPHLNLRHRVVIELEKPFLGAPRRSTATSCGSIRRRKGR